ncbi:MAG: nucleotidyl transferase [Ignavibacteriae bacterium]|nr:MAG: nucleotidyl transferase [Ignavibacteriota bacterium]
MKAIIPAAGVGTRLRPHTYSIPKILLNVAGKPMISYLIDELINVKDLDTIVIIVGHLGDKVEEYIRKTYQGKTGIKFEFVRQKEMLGLAHAVYQAKDFLHNEPVVIILGDTIFEFDLVSFLSQDTSSLGVKDVEDNRRFGVVETINGYISRMIEKPAGPEVTTSRKAIAGLYSIKNSENLIRSIEYIIANNVRTNNEFQLTDALQNMIENGEKFTAFEIENWFDCGKPETLLSTNRYLLEKNFTVQNNTTFPGTLIIPPVSIGDDCEIVNSIIGPNATIGSGSQIKDSIIKNSTVGDNSTINSTLLEDSIIGSEVNITGDYRRLYIGDSTDITF